MGGFSVFADPLIEEWEVVEHPPRNFPIRAKIVFRELPTIFPDSRVVLAIAVV